jgi:hypothetical protein
MKSRSVSAPRSTLSLWAARAALALIAALSSVARAADPVPDGGDAPAMTPPAAPAAPAAAPAPGANFIERLPPSAYPEPVIRGLYGGSLWSTFHGQQWPYYPRTGIGVSGYAWLDSGYERINAPTIPQSTIKEVLQQGRFLLRVTPTYTSGTWFVQAQAELVANKDQTQTQPAVVDTDDFWIRVGQWQTWDLMVGRYEGFEVYHLGMGLDLNTEERRGAYDANGGPPDLYGASFLFYRPGGPGNAALHLYPFRNLRIELLTQVGTDGGFNALGGRGAAVYDLGWLKLKGAYEYQLETSRIDGNKAEKQNRGGGGSVQFVLAPIVEFGLNVGYALVDVFDNVGTPDQGNSYTKYSFGAFANFQLMTDLLLGLGANDVQVTDTHQDDQGNFGKFKNLQTFAAVQYYLGRQLMIKVVGAYASADFEPSFPSIPKHTNSMYSGRIRLMYLF